MRIALVTPNSTPPGPRHPGSRDGRVTALALALGRLGHQVTVYAPRDSGALPRKAAVGPGVTLEHLPVGAARPGEPDGGAGQVPALSDQLARRWRADPPDVAHAHFWTGGLAALAGARGLEVPVVQTFHSLGGTADAAATAAATGRPAASRAGAGPRAAPARGADVAGRPAGASRSSRTGSAAAGRSRPPEQVLHLARLRLEVCLARNVSAVLASSSAELDRLARLGVPRASIRVVPWGVDTGRFAPDGPVAARNGRPRLLAVWQSASDQGLDVVIRALAQVPAAELLIAGGPAGGTGGARQLLAGLASDLRVAERVIFTPAVVSDEDLPALLRSADLLLSGAWDDPPGTVALQAMACGTPVVASVAGPVEDAVIDGTTGLLVPPGQPALLASRIRRLLASPLQLDAFGAAAADRARSRYSWDRIGRETAHAYQRCLPRPLELAGADEPDPGAEQDPDAEPDAGTAVPLAAG